ncbi:CoA ester lyase [Aeromicrobium sp.]|uniref:HpcH/HpaI aldolase/citrate lyase family protein n=1 Tax=Aeromicrobium sp. TaxID=1871063 RepID=UPI0019CE1E00|nr:CoA ester lyase [Aeromicrobium sp.]MBC7630904.1 CoA ester lyase [Aeromicrobium sp.]
MTWGAPTYLYVPGNRPDRFDKAVTVGADGVVIDLEDAVAWSDKMSARSAVAGWLTDLAPAQEPSRVWVRVNHRADLIAADLDAVVRPGLAGIWLPKCDGPDDIAAVAALIAPLEASRGMCELPICPLIETGQGLLAAAAIAACDRVPFLQLGEIDLSVELGIDPDPDGAELVWARGQIVAASAAAGCRPPPAAVSVVTRDLEAFGADTRRFKRQGFWGRACIHPAQVAVAAEVFRPDETELVWARNVLSQLANGGVVLDAQGRLLDEAVARRARRLVADGE